MGFEVSEGIKHSRWITQLYRSLTEKMSSSLEESHKAVIADFNYDFIYEKDVLILLNSKSRTLRQRRHVGFAAVSALDFVLEAII